MCPRFLFVGTIKSAHKGHHPHSHTWSTHGRNRTLTGNHKATAQEPARTSVSSPPTFVPLLATKELCILLPMSFQRERTRLMKLKIFIFLLVNKPPSWGFVFQGR